ncbi:MAG TPA: superoxide dismutase family protein [Steroidobacteraceae bacterium]|nr:superoxide dismutase family protein [Steroidobacteraceae bacterium]
MRTLAGGLVAGTLLSGCGHSQIPAPEASPAGTEQPSEPASSQVNLSGAPGSKVNGMLQLVAMNDGVSVTGEITGLAPNSAHAFHVHETGVCTPPDFESAGGYFDPADAEPGAQDLGEHHLDHMADVKADKTGTAMINTILPGATLRDGGPHDVVGKAIVVQAGTASTPAQPPGNPGDRIACGVIQ